ncbi:MAG: 16S rRNA (guanine(966)-N(2))-methyltransferase RsmD [Lachnospiraceae bacterium]|jgi:16S rRNA (guanine966-N2)-methyltransferase|nr:16S rRNA (guanine(966)-N(2))-methyltransferase RsmD [Lachnospiraceae bacterium]
MRVIAGKARRLPLKTVPGQNTRPTTDRIKETLFNMIQDELYGIRFLDLFAGSGAIGIEALSRGAARAVFVEDDRRAVSCIQENLAFTRLEGGEILSMEVLAALERLKREPSFEVVFMDPPYRKEWERKVLEILADSPVITDHSLVIVEAALDTDFSYLEALGYILLKRKEYKTNAHMFLQRAKGEKK